MSIDPAVLEAVRLLLQVVGPDRMVVIGAMVPMVLIDLQQGGGRGRVTRDVDAVVRAESWEEFRSIKARLIALGFRQGSPQHRLQYHTAEIDLIPYSPALAPGGRLEWPGEDRVMTALGFEEAFECAGLNDIGGVSVPMVSVAGSVLLKLVAYTDRPLERVRDLVDVVHSFNHYADAPGSRRFDVSGVEVDGTPVHYEEAGAYLLGQEVGRLARPKSLALVRQVLASIQDEYAQPIQQILAQEPGHFDNEERRREVYRLFRVFAAGLVSRA